MTEQISNLPNHFSNLEDLSLYRWDKYNQTQDNNWFLVDYDGREKKIISNEIKELEGKLIDDYFKLVNDRTFSIKMQKWAKIDMLRTKYHVVGLLLERMKKGFADWQMQNRWFIITELKSWGFKYPELHNVEEDNLLTANYMSALQGISTQIGLLSNELKEDGKKDKKSLIKQLQIVELGLGYKRKIDPKETSVAEWVEMCKSLEEMSKQN